MNNTSGETGYRLIKALVEKVEAFEAKGGKQEKSLAAFSMWLSHDLAYPRPVTGSIADEEGMPEMGSETLLTMLIAFMFRYAKHYSKKALEGTPLSTLDDFTFLATLSYQGSLTKTELINMHLLEITSGIEIIKRLTKNGLLEVFQDPNDRRSKRVKLSAAGKDVLEDVMVRMDKVARIVSGNLASSEQAQLMPILHKLNDFHAIIHMEDRKSELDTIVSKYLS